MPLSPWKTLSSHYVFNERWLKIRADRCETAEGVIVDPYYIDEPSDWVHVIAFDRNDRILVVHQYRHGSQQIETEIPAGCVEPGEEPLAAIKRELLEETGCVAESIEPLNVLSPNPARYASKMHSFIAFGTENVGEQKLDQSESIEFEFISLAELMSLVDEGKFRHSLHLATLFLALRKRGKASF